MTYEFKREPESGLILVSVIIENKHKLKMVLDTGATNTTIDSNALYLLGYDMKESIGTVEMETANMELSKQKFMGIASLRSQRLENAQPEHILCL